MPGLPVYLDNNATTPVDPEVLDTMLPYFTQHFGNASSRQHAFGWEANEAVEFAREQVAKLIGSENKEVIFTSGATEAINLALKGVYENYFSKGNHIITLETEHKAVLDCLHRLEKMGAEVTYLPVDAKGLADLDALSAAIRPSTILISVMYANNETGLVQPIKSISTLAKKHGIIFFSDATQAVGKIPVDVQEDGIDLMAFSGHKIYGPKGVGALYVRRRDPRVSLKAQIDGGGQERGLRSGTLNVPGIVGLGKATEICRLSMKQEAARLQELRNYMENALLALEETTVNSMNAPRLPHVSNISFNHTEGRCPAFRPGKNDSAQLRFGLYFRITGAFSCSESHGPQ